MTKEEVTKEVNAAFVQAVEKRLAMHGFVRASDGSVSQKAQGWGGEDSVAVIEAVADAAYGAEEGFDVIRGLVSTVVNPSQFRQGLEKKGRVIASERKRGTVAITLK